MAPCYITRRTDPSDTHCACINAHGIGTRTAILTCNSANAAPAIALCQVLQVSCQELHICTKWSTSARSITLCTPKTTPIILIEITTYNLRALLMHLYASTSVRWHRIVSQMKYTMPWVCRLTPSRWILVCKGSSLSKLDQNLNGFQMLSGQWSRVHLLLLVQPLVHPHSSRSCLRYSNPDVGMPCHPCNWIHVYQSLLICLLASMLSLVLQFVFYGCG